VGMKISSRQANDIAILDLRGDYLVWIECRLRWLITSQVLLPGVAASKVGPHPAGGRMGRRRSEMLRSWDS
jgi:hypothetical protein